jgi:hypothetical protein
MFAGCGEEWSTYVCYPRGITVLPDNPVATAGSIEEGEEESDRHSVCSSFGGSAVRMFFVLTMLVSILPLVEWQCAPSSGMITIGFDPKTSSC